MKTYGRYMNKITLTIAIVFLSACQTTPVNYYKPPTQSDTQEVSSLIGSRVKPDNIFHDYETTYVLAIDGLPVKGARGSFNTPVYIEAGKHVVQIANKQGTLLANVAFDIDVKGGEKYVARTEVLDLENIRVWIENGDGERVTHILVGARISGGSVIVPVFM